MEALVEVVGTVVPALRKQLSPAARCKLWAIPAGPDRLAATIDVVVKLMPAAAAGRALETAATASRKIVVWRREPATSVLAVVADVVAETLPMPGAKVVMVLSGWLSPGLRHKRLHPIPEQSDKHLQLNEQRKA